MTGQVAIFVSKPENALYSSVSHCGEVSRDVVQNCLRQVGIQVVVKIVQPKEDGMSAMHPFMGQGRNSEALWRRA